MAAVVGSDVPAAVEGVGGGEMAHFRVHWGWLGCTGGDGDVGGEWGVSLGIDSAVGDVGGVCHTSGGETARLWGVWGELGCWDVFRGCSDGSGGVFRRF
jgi:hypothetical protein